MHYFHWWNNIVYKIDGSVFAFSFYHTYQVYGNTWSFGSLKAMYLRYLQWTIYTIRCLRHVHYIQLKQSAYAWQICGLNIL